MVHAGYRTRMVAPYLGSHWPVVPRPWQAHRLCVAVADAALILSCPVLSCPVLFRPGTYADLGTIHNKKKSTKKSPQHEDPAAAERRFTNVVPARVQRLRSGMKASRWLQSRVQSYVLWESWPLATILTSASVVPAREPCASMSLTTFMPSTLCMAGKARSIP